jgi:hypothetical protein
MGSAVGGSPGRERRCGGQASLRRGGGQKNSVVRHSGAGEGNRRAWRGVECSGGPRGGFYRAEGGRRRGGRSNGGDEWLLRLLRHVKAWFEGD